MILAIVPVVDDEMILKGPANIKYIDYRLFNDIHTHPFIATNVWDSIEITVAPGIVSGYVKQMLTRNNIVVARILKGTEFNFATVSLLTEIYPRVSNEIRKAYMSKGDINSILKEAGAIFE